MSVVTVRIKVERRIAIAATDDDELFAAVLDVVTGAFLPRLYSAGKIARAWSAASGSAYTLNGNTTRWKRAAEELIRVSSQEEEEEEEEEEEVDDHRGTVARRLLALSRLFDVPLSSAAEIAAFGAKQIGHWHNVLVQRRFVSVSAQTSAQIERGLRAFFKGVQLQTSTPGASASRILYDYAFPFETETETPPLEDIRSEVRKDERVHPLKRILFTSPDKDVVTYLIHAAFIYVRTLSEQRDADEDEDDDEDDVFRFLQRLFNGRITLEPWPVSGRAPSGTLARLTPMRTLMPSPHALLAHTDLSRTLTAIYTRWLRHDASKLYTGGGTDAREAVLFAELLGNVAQWLSDAPPLAESDEEHMRHSERAHCVQYARIRDTFWRLARVSDPGASAGAGASVNDGEYSVYENIWHPVQLPSQLFGVTPTTLTPLARSELAVDLFAEQFYAEFRRDTFERRIARAAMLLKRTPLCDHADALLFGKRGLPDVLQRMISPPLVAAITQRPTAPTRRALRTTEALSDETLFHHLSVRSEHGLDMSLGAQLSRALVWRVGAFLHRSLWTPGTRTAVLTDTRSGKSVHRSALAFNALLADLDTIANKQATASKLLAAGAWHAWTPQSGAASSVTLERYMGELLDGLHYQASARRSFLEAVLAAFAKRRAHVDRQDSAGAVRARLWASAGAAINEGMLVRIMDSELAQQRIAWALRHLWFYKLRGKNASAQTLLTLWPVLSRLKALHAEYSENATLDTGERAREGTFLAQHPITQEGDDEETSLRLNPFGYTRGVKDGVIEQRFWYDIGVEIPAIFLDWFGRAGLLSLEDMGNIAQSKRFHFLTLACLSSAELIDALAPLLKDPLYTRRVVRDIQRRMRFRLPHATSHYVARPLRLLGDEAIEETDDALCRLLTGGLSLAHSGDGGGGSGEQNCLRNLANCNVLEVHSTWLAALTGQYRLVPARVPLGDRALAYAALTVTLQNTLPYQAALVPLDAHAARFDSGQLNEETVAWYRRLSSLTHPIDAQPSSAAAAIASAADALPREPPLAQVYLYERYGATAERGVLHSLADVFRLHGYGRVPLALRRALANPGFALAIALPRGALWPENVFAELFASVTAPTPTLPWTWTLLYGDNELSEVEDVREARAATVHIAEALRGLIERVSRAREALSGDAPQEFELELSEFYRRLPVPVQVGPHAEDAVHPLSVLLAAFSSDALALTLEREIATQFPSFTPSADGAVRLFSEAVVPLVAFALRNPAVSLDALACPLLTDHALWDTMLTLLTHFLDRQPASDSDTFQLSDIPRRGRLSSFFHAVLAELAKTGKDERVPKIRAPEKSLESARELRAVLRARLLVYGEKLDAARAHVARLCALPSGEVTASAQPLLSDIWRLSPSELVLTRIVAQSRETPSDELVQVVRVSAPFELEDWRVYVLSAAVQGKIPLLPVFLGGGGSGGGAALAGHRFGMQLTSQGRLTLLYHRDGSLDQLAVDYILAMLRFLAHSRITKPQRFHFERLIEDGERSVGQLEELLYYLMRTFLCHYKPAQCMQMNDANVEEALLVEIDALSMDAWAEQRESYVSVLFGHTGTTYLRTANVKPIDKSGTGRFKEKAASAYRRFFRKLLDLLFQARRAFASTNANTILHDYRRYHGEDRANSLDIDATLASLLDLMTNNETRENAAVVRAHLLDVVNARRAADFRKLLLAAPNPNIGGRVSARRTGMLLNQDALNEFFTKRRVAEGTVEGQQQSMVIEEATTTTTTTTTAKETRAKKRAKKRGKREEREESQIPLQKGRAEYSLHVRDRIDTTITVLLFVALGDIRESIATFERAPAELDGLARTQYRRDRLLTYLKKQAAEVRQAAEEVRLSLMERIENPTHESSLQKHITQTEKLHALLTKWMRGLLSKNPLLGGQLDERLDCAQKFMRAYPAEYVLQWIKGELATATGRRRLATVQKRARKKAIKRKQRASDSEARRSKWPKRNDGGRPQVASPSPLHSQLANVEPVLAEESTLSENNLAAINMVLEAAPTTTTTTELSAIQDAFLAERQALEKKKIRQDLIQELKDAGMEIEGGEAVLEEVDFADNPDSWMEKVPANLNDMQFELGIYNNLGASQSPAVVADRTPKNMNKLLASSNDSLFEGGLLGDLNLSQPAEAMELQTPPIIRETLTLPDSWDLEPTDPRFSYSDDEAEEEEEEEE